MDNEESPYASPDRRVLVCWHVRRWDNQYPIIGPICEKCETELREKDPDVFDAIEDWRAECERTRRQLLERIRRGVSRGKPRRRYPVSEGRLSQMWGLLPLPYKRFFRELINNPDGLKTEQAMEILGCQKLALRTAIAVLGRMIRSTGMQSIRHKDSASNSVLKNYEIRNKEYRGHVFLLSREALRYLPGIIAAADMADQAAPSE